MPITRGIHRVMEVMAAVAVFQQPFCWCSSQLLSGTFSSQENKTLLFAQIDFPHLHPCMAVSFHFYFKKDVPRADLLIGNQNCWGFFLHFHLFQIKQGKFFFFPRVRKGFRKMGYHLILSPYDKG